MCYQLEDSVTYVPDIISNLLLVWTVYMLLAYPLPTFYGLGIGMIHSILAKTTPTILGTDLFFPPYLFTVACEFFFNPEDVV